VDGGQHHAQRVGQRLDILLRQVGEQFGDPARVAGPASLQHRPALVGQGDQGDPTVGRIGAPHDQPALFETLDELGHGRLGHALRSGQRSDPLPAAPLQRSQRRNGRQAQVAVVRHAADDEGDYLEQVRCGLVQLHVTFI
jgi:hypothetical protein